MKVIMPMAGKGTRLLPLTKRVPKPLVNVAGRPVMDYVMEALKRAGTLDELIIITGHLKEKVEQYVRSHYDIPARFVEQKVLDGIDHVMKSPPGKGGEFYLTDAFQYMVDQGKKLYVSEVGGWYDCGKVDTLLETNQHLLEHGRARRPAKIPAGVKIKEPVYIEDGVTLKDATVGPNVSIESGSTIVGSTIANSILGRGTPVKNATVEGSLVGDQQTIEGRNVKDSVMDGGELAPARWRH